MERGGGGGGEGEAVAEVRKCERMGGEGRRLLTDGDKRRLIFMCVDLRLVAEPAEILQTGTHIIDKA